MIIEGYGITLVRLRWEHIEQVRVWRNQDLIQAQMQYRDFITSEMQQAWFKKVNTLENNYFMIEIDGQSIGLVHGAQIDWVKKVTYSGGIFIGNRTFWDTKYPMAASLLLTDLSVICGLKATYVEVLETNRKAQAYNRLLGYRQVEAPNTNGACRYVLKSGDYVKKRKLLRDLYFEEAEYNMPNINLTHSSSELQRFYSTILKLPLERGEIRLLG